MTSIRIGNVLITWHYAATHVTYEPRQAESFAFGFTISLTRVPGGARMGRKGFKIHPAWFGYRMNDKNAVDQAERDAKRFCDACDCDMRGHLKGCECGNICSCHYAAVKRVLDKASA